jgi:hypothetical protein
MRHTTIETLNPEQPKTKAGQVVRQGLFKAASRPFGETYMEGFIRKIYDLEKIRGSECDALDPTTNETIEIKAARALVPVEAKGNYYERLETIASQYDNMSRIVSFYDRTLWDYNANIQNVKRHKFDKLIYAVLFSEGIEFFQVVVPSINEEGIRNWSGLHGSEEVAGRNGQFNINRDSILEHESKYFNFFMSYDELALIAQEIDG